MIELKSITKKISNKTIIDNISLTIDKPIIYGLLGANGAGKTTLINLITGIYSPSFGQLTSSVKKENIGYMPEETGLYMDMSIEEEILYFGNLHNMSKENIKKKASPLLKIFNLEKETHKLIKNLSKGTIRKVQFICTILHSPKLIILDEPFSGIDAYSSILLEKELLKLKNEGCAIILSTHRIEHAELFCDHFFIIKNGVKVLDESSTILKNKRNKNSFIFSVSSKINFEKHFLYEEAKFSDYYEYRVAIDNNFNYEEFIEKITNNNKLISFNQELYSLKELIFEK